MNHEEMVLARADVDRILLCMEDLAFETRDQYPDLENELDECIKLIYSYFEKESQNDAEKERAKDEVGTGPGSELVDEATAEA